MQIDYSLLDKCMRDDERAQLMLYKECYSLMKGVCSRYIQEQSDVADVMNRGFLKIIKGLGQFDRHRSFEAWVRRILVNTALDHLRQKKRRAAHEVAHPMESLNGIDVKHTDWNHADRSFDAEELLQMINSLPIKTAQVFNLFAIDGYSHQEISELLDMKEGTSKWHVSKAREYLKELLTKKRTKKGQLT